MNLIIEQTYKKYFNQDGWVRHDDVLIKDEELSATSNEYIEGARTSARHARNIAILARGAHNQRVVVLGRPITQEQFAARVDRRLVDDNLADKFNQLADEWKNATKITSSSTAIVLHPAYQRIIGLGPHVIGLILRDLESNGGQWHPALKALTGQDPTRPEDAGRIRAIKEAWLDWGRRNGYI